MPAVRSLLACILVFLGGSIAVPATMAGGDSLFSAGDSQFSIFGESANGNIDASLDQFVVHHHETQVVTHARVIGFMINPPGLARPLFEIDRTTKTRFFSQIIKTERTEHNAGGGGLQYSYFWSRYAGIAADADFLRGTAYNTALTASLVLRWPFEFGTGAGDSRSIDPKERRWGLAPYIMAGAGGQWGDRAAGVGAIGGGVEFRFEKHWGFFVQSRWIAHDQRQNYMATAAGVTFTF